MATGWELEAEHQAGDQSKGGTQENLWPKLILKSAPIARHFVCSLLKHTPGQRLGR